MTTSFRVHSGDTVRVRCVYNNTRSNHDGLEMLAELGLTEPADVGLGEATGDAMCLTCLGETTGDAMCLTCLGVAIMGS